MDRDKLQSLQEELLHLKQTYGTDLRLRKSTSDSTAQAPFPITLQLHIPAPPSGDNFDVGSVQLHVKLLPNFLQNPGCAVLSVNSTDLPDVLQKAVARKLQEAYKKEVQEKQSGWHLAFLFQYISLQWVPLISCVPTCLEPYEAVNAAGATVRRYAIVAPAQPESDSDQPAPATEPELAAQPASVPTGPESAPARHQSSSAQDESVAPECALAPIEPKSASAKVEKQNQPESAQAQPESVQDQPESAQGQPESVQDQPGSAHDEPESAQDQPESAQDQPQPARDQLEAAQAQPEQAQAQSEVAQCQHVTDTAQPEPLQALTESAPTRPESAQAQPESAQAQIKATQDQQQQQEGRQQTRQRSRQRQQSHDEEPAFHAAQHSSQHAQHDRAENYKRGARGRGRWAADPGFQDRQLDDGQARDRQLNDRQSHDSQSHDRQSHDRQSQERLSDRQSHARQPHDRQSQERLHDRQSQDRPARGRQSHDRQSRDRQPQGRQSHDMQSCDNHKSEEAGGAQNEPPYYRQPYSRDQPPPYNNQPSHHMVRHTYGTDQPPPNMHRFQAPSSMGRQTHDRNQRPLRVDGATRDRYQHTDTVDEQTHYQEPQAMSTDKNIHYTEQQPQYTDSEGRKRGRGRRGRGRGRGREGRNQLWHDSTAEHDGEVGRLSSSHEGCVVDAHMPAGRGRGREVADSGRKADRVQGRQEMEAGQEGDDRQGRRGRKGRQSRQDINVYSSVGNDDGGALGSGGSRPFSGVDRDDIHSSSAARLSRGSYDGQSGFSSSSGPPGCAPRNHQSEFSSSPGPPGCAPRKEQIQFASSSGPPGCAPRNQQSGLSSSSGPPGLAPRNQQKELSSSPGPPGHAPRKKDTEQNKLGASAPREQPERGVKQQAMEHQPKGRNRKDASNKHQPAPTPISLIDFLTVADARPYRRAPKNTPDKQQPGETHKEAVSQELGKGKARLQRWGDDAAEASEFRMRGSKVTATAEAVETAAGVSAAEATHPQGIHQGKAAAAAVPATGSGSGNTGTAAAEGPVGGAVSGTVSGTHASRARVSRPPVIPQRPSVVLVGPAALEREMQLLQRRYGSAFKMGCKCSCEEFEEAENEPSTEALVHREGDAEDKCGGGKAGEDAGEEAGRQTRERMEQQVGEKAGEQAGPQTGGEAGEQMGEQGGKPLGEQDRKGVGEQDGKAVGDQDGKPVGEQGNEQLGEHRDEESATIGTQLIQETPGGKSITWQLDLVPTDPAWGTLGSVQLHGSCQEATYPAAGSVSIHLAYMCRLDQTVKSNVAHTIHAQLQQGWGQPKVLTNVLRYLENHAGSIAHSTQQGSVSPTQPSSSQLSNSQRTSSRSGKHTSSGRSDKRASSSSSHRNMHGGVESSGGPPTTTGKTGKAKTAAAQERSETGSDSTSETDWWDVTDGKPGNHSRSHSSAESSGAESDEFSEGEEAGSSSGAEGGLGGREGAAVFSGAGDASVSEVAGGYGVLLEGLQLDQVAVLEVVKANVQVTCSRCSASTSLSLSSVPPTPTSPPFSAHTPCPGCHQPLSLLLRPKFVHASSNNLGSLKPIGCRPLDLLPSVAAVQCAECSAVCALREWQVGMAVGRKCSGCHRELSILVAAVSFVPRRAPGTTSSSSKPSGPVSRRKDPTRAAATAGSATIQVGQPLPAMGACKHYRHSYRWLRFPCCGMRFACDLCHEEGTDGHEPKWALRMVCGFCSLEQAVGDRCSGCSRRLACGSSHPSGRNTRFWEGGEGCRDKKRMSRKDPHRYRNTEAKTKSGKAARVGPKPWSRGGAGTTD